MNARLMSQDGQFILRGILDVGRGEAVSDTMRARLVAARYAYGGSATMRLTIQGQRIFDATEDAARRAEMNKKLERQRENARAAEAFSRTHYSRYEQ